MAKLITRKDTLTTTGYRAYSIPDKQVFEVGRMDIDKDQFFMSGYEAYTCSQINRPLVLMQISNHQDNSNFNIWELDVLQVNILGELIGLGVVILDNENNFKFLFVDKEDGHVCRLPLNSIFKLFDHVSTIGCVYFHIDKIPEQLKEFILDISKL